MKALHWQQLQIVVLKLLLHPWVNLCCWWRCLSKDARGIAVGPGGFLVLIGMTVLPTRTQPYRAVLASPYKGVDHWPRPQHAELCARSSFLPGSLSFLLWRVQPSLNIMHLSGPAWMHMRLDRMCLLGKWHRNAPGVQRGVQKQREATRSTHTAKRNLLEVSKCRVWPCAYLLGEWAGGRGSVPPRLVF